MNLLKKTLDDLNKNRDFHRDLLRDPLSFVHRYHHQNDREIAAVFSSALAYGRVSLFFPVIEALLSEADRWGGPYQWIQTFNRQSAKRISSIYYRLNKAPDFALLAISLQGVLKEYPSLEHLFKKGYHRNDRDFDPALAYFVDSLLKSAQKHAHIIEHKDALPRGFRHFLPSPKTGSACKRWNLFLRWMIRTEFPDLGLWDLPTHKLTIPLDVHVHQISTLLGLSTKKSANNRSAKEITNALRKLDDQDPVRYDFPIAHLGISGACQKKYVPNICTKCVVNNICTLEKR